jgi:hypothetical protein
MELSNIGAPAGRNGARSICRRKAAPQQNPCTNSKRNIIKNLQKVFKETPPEASMSEKINVLLRLSVRNKVFEEQVARSKAIHGRSVRAYMKASASASAKWLREAASMEDDDDSSGDV